MSIKLKGSSDGSVSFDAPADTSPSGSDITLVLPTTVGSAEQFLKNSGTAGTLEFSSMVETSTGVGIGTSSPSRKLHIVPSGSNAYDAVQVGDGLYIGNTSNNNNAAVFHQGGGADLEIGSQQHITFTTGDIAGSATERMRINSSGNVGIGTTSPEVKFTVSGTAAEPPSSGTTANSLIQLKSNLTTELNIGLHTVTGDYGAYIQASDNNLAVAYPLNLQPNGGNVGIGTTSPVGKTYIAGPNASTFGVAADAALNLAAANGALSGRVVNLNFAVVPSSTNAAAAIGMKYTSQSGNGKGDLIFGTRNVTTDTAPTERMRIDSAGTVSIGSSIIGDASDGQGILFTDGGFIRLGNSTGSGSSTMAEFKTGASSTQVLRFQCDGDIENQNNRYSAISDVNLKENIVDADSQWDDIKNIRVRKYNFREDTGLQTNTQIGVIAQEVELISPGLVKDAYDVAEDGSSLETSRKSVSYSVLYMKAVKALQEAMDRIETLEAKVAALEAQ